MVHYQTRGLMRAGVAFTVKGCPAQTPFPFLVCQRAFTPSNSLELLQNLMAGPPQGIWGCLSRTNPLIAARDTSLSSLCEGWEKGLWFVASQWIIPEAHTTALSEKAVVCVITIPENTRWGRVHHFRWEIFCLSDSSWSKQKLYIWELLFSRCSTKCISQ